MDGGVVLLEAFAGAVHQKLYFDRFGLFDGVGEEGPGDDSFGYELEFRVGGSHHCGSIRHGVDIGDEIETLAETGFGVERSNGNREFLATAVGTDQQNLTIENFGFGREVCRK